MSLPRMAVLDMVIQVLMDLEKGLSATSDEFALHMTRSLRLVHEQEKELEEIRDLIAQFKA